MRLRALLPVAALAAATAFTNDLAAVDDLTVSVTMTIAATLDIRWCASDGTGESTAAQSWALGTIALSSVNQSNGASPEGTQPTLRYIENFSNCTVDISAECSDTASWTAESAAGANQFKMEANLANGAYTTLDPVAVDDFIELAEHATNTVRSSEIGLQFTAPSSITLGAGVTQTITVTFTATADTGD